MRVGWALALLVMLFGASACADRADSADRSEAAYEYFLAELPGAEGPNFGEKIDQQQTGSGARVTLERAYADERFVVLVGSFEDLRDGERALAGRPAELVPIFYSKRGAGTGHNPVELNDEVGTDFELLPYDSLYEVYRGPDDPQVPRVWQATFEASQRIEPSQRHRFRLEIPLQVRAVVSSEKDAVHPNPVGQPFVFEFEVPVRSTPVVEVGQADMANGLRLTLDRVVDSPGRPQAIMCFEPPDDEHTWGFYNESTPFASRPATGQSGEYCRELLLHERLEGRSSLTVTKIEGIPLRMPSGHDEASGHHDKFNKRVKTISGPWRFEFEVPGS